MVRVRIHGCMLQALAKLLRVADISGLGSKQRRAGSTRSASRFGPPVRFAAKRVVGLVAVLLAISFGTFGLLAIAPGDPAQLLLGTREQSPAVLQSVRHEYHLDRPFLTQYGIWLEHAARFDFGRSIRTNEPVSTGDPDRLGLSLSSASSRSLIALALGVPLGVLAAVRTQTRGSTAGVVALSVVGVSAPAFASGDPPALRVRGRSSAGSPSSARAAGVVDRIVPPRAARRRARADGDGARRSS